jgi:hypothetical protein
MARTIGSILALAIGVALSPFLIVAVILMLFSPDARTNVSRGIPAYARRHADPAGHQALDRPSRPRDGTSLPEVDGHHRPDAAGLDALVAGVSPKNLILNHSAVIAIVRTDASTSGQVLAMLACFMIASPGVAGPVLWCAASPAAAATRLEPLRVWLIHHNASIVAVILGVLGLSRSGRAPAAPAGNRLPRER